MGYLKCDYDQSKLASEYANNRAEARLDVETDHVIIEYSLFSVILIKNERSCMRCRCWAAVMNLQSENFNALRATASAIVETALNWNSVA